MALKFSLSFDIERAIGQMGLVMTRRLAVATVRGINRTADSEKSGLGSAVAKDMGIKVAAAKAAITVKRATVNHPVARVMATGARIPLIHFSARGPEPSRGRGKGVSYRMQGTTHRLPHAFITRVGSGGHRGVFERSGAGRLPIHEKFGPSIAHVFGKQIPLREGIRREVLVKNVQHEIEFALSKGA